MPCCTLHLHWLLHEVQFTVKFHWTCELHRVSVRCPRPGKAKHQTLIYRALNPSTWCCLIEGKWLTQCLSPGYFQAGTKDQELRLFHLDPDTAPLNGFLNNQCCYYVYVSLSAFLLSLPHMHTHFQTSDLTLRSYIVLLSKSLHALLFNFPKPTARRPFLGNRNSQLK